MSETSNQMAAAIKNRLILYTELLREIDNQRERLECHIISMGPSSPNLTGMPSSHGSYSQSKVARDVEKKIELEEQIEELVAEEREEHQKLERLIRKIKNPDERAVLRMRYFDREEWQDITHSLFHKEKDYKRAFQNYQKRAFNLHGAAINQLARLAEKNQ